MNKEAKNTDRRLKDIFREIPLERLSSNFTENLLYRLEKEIIKEKRKKQVLTVLQWAVSIISIFYIPGLAIYLCRIFIPDFSFSFSFTLAKIHIEPVILLIGFSVLFLLIADILLRKYSRKQNYEDNTN
jgi:H+/Cl- antiporter ClcA